MRLRILRRLIAPFNWHKGGHCVFPVLCMYDDMLLWEMEGYWKGRAAWRRAKAYRRDIDNAFRQYVRDAKPD